MTREETPLVVPFVGERYADTAGLSRFLAPPYDVITPEQRLVFAREPHNVVHVTLPEDDADRYGAAARTLETWRNEGVLVRDAEPSVTVVQESFVTPDGECCVRSGLLAAVRVEPYHTGRVRPHERTHAGPKQDRLALLRATRAMCEALLMVTRDEGGGLRRALAAVTSETPLAQASLQGVRIRVWRVVGAAAEELAAAAHAPLYLADGHHRYETAVAYRAEQPTAVSIPALVVPLGDPGLVVLPTHRVVYGDPISEDRLVDDLRGRFQVRELDLDEDPADVVRGMASRGTACCVVLPDRRVFAFLLKGGAPLGDLASANEPTLASLDVVRIDEIVLKRLVALAGDGVHVGYSSDAVQAARTVELGAAAAAVMLNPAQVEQVLAVADAGAAMPQKSTYFFPKVASGIALMSYEPA